MYIIEGISNKKANQQIQFSAEGLTFTLRFHIFRDILYCSVFDGTTLIRGSIKCTKENFFFPYKHMYLRYGNFTFLDVKDTYLPFQDINRISKLAYLTPNEMKEILESVS